MPENFLEINRYFALTSYCNTIGQSRNAFSILEVCAGGWGEGEAMFLSFHPLADKKKQITNTYETIFHGYTKIALMLTSDKLILPRRLALWLAMISRYSGLENIAHVKRISFTSKALGYSWATFTRHWTIFRPVECSCV